jgi:hypothetical protein
MSHKEKSMIIRVDIDNTICDTVDADYKNAQPRKSRIDQINALYDQGHEIIYWTSRGVVTGKNWVALTTNQLHSWGCRFTRLECTKPYFDLFIDDKALRADDNGFIMLKMLTVN